MRFFAPFVAAVLGNLLYHTSQRLTPAAANPLLSVGLSFALGSTLCLLAYAASRHTLATLSADISALSWTTIGLGFAVAIIETSFLLAYRFGWPLGITSLAVTALQTALLIPIGRVFLAERLTPAGWAGVALCLAGLTLVGLSVKPA